MQEKKMVKEIMRGNSFAISIFLHPCLSHFLPIYLSKANKKETIFRKYT